MYRPVVAAPPLPQLLQFLPLYFLLAGMAVWLERQPGQIGTLWFAAALGAAWLLRQPPAQAPLLLLGALCAELLARLALGDNAGHAALAALPATLEMALAAALLRRVPARYQFDASPQGFLLLLLLGCCAPPLLGATLAAWWRQPALFESFGNAWGLHYMGATIGALAMLPLARLALRPGPSLAQRLGALHIGLLALLALATCGGALLYMPFPFMAIVVPLTCVALALSFEHLALLSWMCAAVCGAMLSCGLFLPPPIYGRWQEAMIYVPLLAVLVPPLMLAVSINQVRRKDAQRIKVERELERNHQKLQTIIDHMPALVGYWDRSLMNGFGNRAYLEWFGKTPEQMRGRHIREVIGEERYRLNLPHMEAALRGESPLFERTIVGADGATRYSLASYVPDVVDGKVIGFYAFVTDISPLKQAQRQQQEARTQLQAVIDSASEFSIITTDRAGLITLFSRGAQRMLGYSAEELVGLHTPLLLHLADEMAVHGAALAAELGHPVEGMEIFVARARLGQADLNEWHYRRKDGSRVPVRLVVTAMRDADGAIVGFLGIASDITEQRQLQDSLVMSKELAEAASLAKSEFVANMSHEIRTPLNAVLGMAYLLDTPALAPEQRRYVAMIRASGRSLLSILNDILDFEKVEAGRMELSPLPFRLDEVLGTLANIMTVNAAGKPLDLALGLAPDVPRALVGDGGRLQQVLVNLVGNAIKFTAEGEVALWIERVAQRATTPGRVLLRFSVHDTGIGIDAAQQQRLFGAFAQGDSSISRRYGGTGLGLVISRRLVELMGGHLELHSAAGQGSEFSVTLPFRLGSDEALAEAGPVWPALRLLLVGPPRTSRDYLDKTLRAWQAQVDTADSGPEAVARLHARLAGGGGYDAVLMDWQMADMDGVATMQALRALLPGGALPVLLLVDAAAHGGLIGQPGAAEADAVLVKPLTGSALHELLRRLLAGEAAAAPAAGAEPTPAAPLAGVRLLLVEDNALNQIVARGMLQQVGASVTLAEDGAVALERLRAGPADFDLVLMDIQMPQMDGYSATRAIRAQLGLDLPILAMTAGVTQNEQRQCLAAGMNDVVAKPIELERLLAAIGRQLGGRGAAGQPAGTARSAGVAARTTGAATARTTGAVAAQTAGAAVRTAGAVPAAGAPVPTPPAPPAAAPSADGATADGLDQLFQLGGGDTAYADKMLSLIEQTVERAGAELAQARDAWRDERRDDSMRQLHSLRGSVGMLGAKQFAALSLLLEQAIAAGDRDQAERHFGAAEAALRPTLAAARRWIERQR
ncbi:response regulator [Rugamonas sp. DEMB1]|uniref:hybrid sensor histidine kinase/response regulator n=1 Tax=Rugamonas sp. DEMB1 TaxID=3039386 RepID=UPI00244929BF|nr:response regulator [Rugamonas sp. DEMB1]WGG51451.1 response regulator [Rugamonas sp. DEMB1]